MAVDSIPHRFDRTARLLGAEAVRRLAGCHVAVFGLGGVGSYAAEGLARSGVGRLTLVDFDDVCVTNINRQLHAFPQTVGQSKAALMADRVKAINPAAEARGIRAFYDKDSSATLLDPAPDVVVDCIDNITAKLHLIATCLTRHIPVVTCLGASARLDPTRVKTATLADTHMDPLARVVRKALRRKYGVPESRLEEAVAVFSDEPVTWPDPDYRGGTCGVTCVCPNQDNARHTCRKRHIIHGSAVFVTSVFGMVAAGIAVGRITGRYSPRLAGYVIRERRLKKARQRRKPAPDAAAQG